jgi:hypothetical protein
MDHIPQQHGRQAAADHTSGEHEEEDDRDVQRRGAPFESDRSRASLGGRARF